MSPASLSQLASSLQVAWPAWKEAQHTVSPIPIPNTASVSMLPCRACLPFPPPHFLSVHLCS